MLTHGVKAATAISIVSDFGSSIDMAAIGRVLHYDVFGMLFHG